MGEIALRERAAYEPVEPRSAEPYLVRISGATREIPDLRRYLEDRGIESVIRIHEHEYNSFAMQRRLTHFNLPPCWHMFGKNYLLAKIIKPGYKTNDGQELRPVLSFDGCLVGECVGMRQKVSYGELQHCDFLYSFDHIKTPSELMKMMIKRYGASRPDYSVKQIIRAGVSITTLKILGMFSEEKQFESEC